MLDTILNEIFYKCLKWKWQGSRGLMNYRIPKNIGYTM